MATKEDVIEVDEDVTATKTEKVTEAQDVPMIETVNTTYAVPRTAVEVCACSD